MFLSHETIFKTVQTNIGNLSVSPLSWYYVFNFIKHNYGNFKVHSDPLTTLKVKSTV